MNKTLWMQQEEPTCVVLCGGKGSRLLPLSLHKQKAMIEICNKPILGYLVDYWCQFTSNFLFVVKYKKEGIMDYVKTLSINARFTEPFELCGIANGISYVKEMVTNSFIVVLGDCVCKGEFDFPHQMECGVGVWRAKESEDIKRSYSVQIKNGLLDGVVEKPEAISNDLCGMGFYFFNKKVFKYIDQAKPSTLRNEIEITDVIQNMIEAGESVSPIMFNGEYINVTYTKDIERVENMLK